MSSVERYHEQLMRRLVECRVITFTADNPFVLKSGIESHVYVNGRNDLTENPDLLRLVGERIAEKAELLRAERGDSREICFIGIPTAGYALAQAAALCGPRVPGYPFRIMRSMLKQYGAHKRWVDGVPDSNRFLYVVIDNVITDGYSKKQMNDCLQEDGYPVAEIPHIVLVDRQQGGIERLRREGIQVEAVFNLLDLVRDFAKYGLWPAESVAMVEEEIAAHQF